MCNPPDASTMKRSEVDVRQVAYLPVLEALLGKPPKEGAGQQWHSQSTRSDFCLLICDFSYWSVHGFAVVSEVGLRHLELKQLCRVEAQNFSPVLIAELAHLPFDRFCRMRP